MYIKEQQNIFKHNPLIETIFFYTSVILFYFLWVFFLFFSTTVLKVCKNFQPKFLYFLTSKEKNTVSTVSHEMCNL